MATSPHGNIHNGMRTVRPVFCGPDYPRRHVQRSVTRAQLLGPRNRGHDNNTSFVRLEGIIWKH